MYPTLVFCIFLLTRLIREYQGCNPDLLYFGVIDLNTVLTSVCLFAFEGQLGTSFARMDIFHGSHNELTTAGSYHFNNAIRDSKHV